MAKSKTYYVTVQDKDGVAVGGRLRIEDLSDTGAIRFEAGYLVQEMLEELGRG